jgi:hypothetical protein
MTGDDRIAASVGVLELFVLSVLIIFPIPIPDFVIAAPVQKFSIHWSAVGMA